MGDDNSSQSVVSAIVEMKDSMIESSEMSQMMILDRLLALEEAVSGSGNKMVMAVSKSNATRKSY